MIDCGEGTQIQLRKNRIKFSRIDNIFISHLHGDHIFGLYGLLSTFNLMGRVSPLQLFAPERFQEIFPGHLDDFGIRLSFEIVFTPLKEKGPIVIFENKYVFVEAFPLEHRIPSYGFLFREKPGDRLMIKECITK